MAKSARWAATKQGAGRRASQPLAQQPDGSLRDVARGAGMSPATVLDVRKRLERGESPVPQKLGSAARKGSVGNGAEDDASNDGACAQTIRFSSRAAAPPDPAATMVKLLRDPSLRNNERGKGMLQLLQINAVGA